MRNECKTGGASGFTLVEIVIAVAIAGVLLTLGLSSYADYRERIRVNQAIREIGLMAVVVSKFEVDSNSLPDSLSQVGMDGQSDPWGRPYEYFNLSTAKGNGKARKDKSLNPLNSDFDLYSVGRDGSSHSSLMAKASRDDVLRARDGRFIGLATDFDP
jgi:general secretion pathway protein G